MTPLEKRVFSKLFAKTELEKQRVELANIKEVESILDNGYKKHAEAVDLAKKAELYFKMANNAAISAEKTINDIIKAGNDLGLDTSFAESRLDMIKTLKQKTEKSLNLNYIP